MVFGWSLFLAWTLAAAPENYPRFSSWLAQDTTWIRVGLKKPSEMVELSSNSVLLVLDGDKVVDTIEPKGTFYLLAQTNPGGGFMVQVAALSNRSALLQEKNALTAKFPNYKAVLAPVAGRMTALRIGPFSDREDADQARADMVAEGYQDAFIKKIGRETRYFWVNKRFDKFELRSGNLGLARLNPENPIGFAGTAYRGMLRLRREGKRIRVINVLPLEVYLRGVVPSELGPKVYPQVEALKAQATAARTYALKNMGRFARNGYDICDSPACQAYDGTKNEDPLSDRAIRETAGNVMSYEGELIDALYTSTCGGHTEDVGNVFPGRDEAYLKGVSSYVAAYQSWTLPSKPVNREAVARMPEDMAVKTILYGFPAVPDVAGNLTVNGFTAALGYLDWVLGEAPAIPANSDMDYRTFWSTVSQLPFFRDAAARQVSEADLKRLMRPYQVAPELASFAGLLIRFGLVRPEQLTTFSSTKKIPALEALTILLDFCENLGPTPSFRRYRLEGMNGDTLRMRRGKQIVEKPLSKVRHYLSQPGEALSFLEKPTVEELDLIYTLDAPFPDDLLLVRDNGSVASVDRFSSVEAWLEKKDAETLEKRARRYVRDLRGLKDIRVLERSETGRVTLLEWVADSGTYRVDGLRIRWSLGIRDNLFDMLPAYKNGRLVHATFAGRGWGHGVGMSQVGAYGLARMGWDYQRILKHYYSGIEIGPFQSLSQP